MPRETLGVVRLIWTCPSCQVRNPGPNRFCSGCGAPQPANVSFEKPSEAEYLKNEQDLAAARAGADFHCGYCGARNPAGSRSCSQCSADLTGSQVRAAGQVIGSPNTAPAAAVNCPACHSSNPADAQRCGACGAPLRPASAPPPPAQTARSGFPKGLILIGLAVLAGIILVISLLSSTARELSAVVQSVSWQRSLNIQQYREVTREDWRSSIPAGAELLSCRSRLAGTSSQPAANSVKVCGTPYLVDMGNGYAEAVQDCYYEVYEDYCTYRGMDWVTVDTLVVSGTDLNTYWPDFNPSASYREGGRAEQYTVVFNADGGFYRYQPSSYQEFLRFQPGSRWTLEINAFDQLVGVRP